MSLIAYDPVLKRPGCVLIAAALGADSRHAHAFPTESWLLSPTPNMGVFPVTQDQLRKLVAMTEAAMKEQAK